MSKEGYLEPELINIKDTKTGLSMLDSLSRLKAERRIKPLDQMDNVQYSHRYLYDEYNLQIGDCYFMIPPEFIMVVSESTSQRLVTLRQENTTKLKSGYHKRTIIIDLVFNGLDELNGFKVKSPEGYYYVDGLRQLLAHFKCTPFLPISNQLLNGTYGIFTVALQSINISTMQGFPDTMTAQINLQEVNMFPYIEMPDFAFQFMIDWDLLRFYYQRFLTENHTYKKLQSLSSNKDRTHFRISILDGDVLVNKKGKKVSKKSLLNIVTNDDNYILWLDSDKSDVQISSFQCGYSNLLTNIQLSDAHCPTIQFMGGMDTIYTINFETKDYSVVQALEQCQINNDLLTRENIKLRSVGFVKLESELVEFTGSLFVVIESVSVNTVPGFPNLYNVQMNCISYDIAQSNRETLNGFRPFDCDRCSSNSFNPDHTHKEETISQDIDGWETKIKQDNYAEWKLRTSIELYPDLRLPTYNEVNEFIAKCIKFRKDGLYTDLPYTSYPTSPEYMLHGLNPNIEYDINLTTDEHNIVNFNALDTKGLEYNMFVDPDFYVFYPISYMSFEEETQQQDSKTYYDLYTPSIKKSYEVVKKETIYKDNGFDTDSIASSSLLEQFCQICLNQIGQDYVWGAYGDDAHKNYKGLTFDCSGLVTYALRQCGITNTRETTASIRNNTSNLYIDIPLDERQRGDLLVNGHHVVVYLGNNQIVHAPKPGDQVRKQSYYSDNWQCKRIRAFTSSLKANSNTSNNTYTLTAGKYTKTIDINRAKETWDLLKSYGFTDIATAGIMGNIIQESGGSFDPTYVQGGSHSDTDVSGTGYGLFQFTSSNYKKGDGNIVSLTDWCNSNNKSVNTIDGQVGYFTYVFRKYNYKGTSFYNALNNATTVNEATQIHEAWEQAGKPVMEVRYAGADWAYQTFSGTTPTSTTYLDNTINEDNKQLDTVLTESEFEDICRTVMGECIAEYNDYNSKIDVTTAIAQVIYDRLTEPNKRWGNLFNILNSTSQFKPKYDGAIDDDIRTIVKRVFCDNKKYFKNNAVYYFITTDTITSSFDQRDNQYIRLGTLGTHTFWGPETKKSENIKFTIVSDDIKNSSNDINYIKETKVEYKAVDIGSELFGKPILIDTKKYMYMPNVLTGDLANKTKKENAKEYLNKTTNTFNSAFVNEVQYSCKGKLTRAFPTYLLCILDDQRQWYDCRQLWTNYYITKSVIDIAVHETNDMPTSTATIVVANAYHNLDRVQTGLSSYSILNDDAYNSLSKWIYKYTGLVPGFGPKLTKRIIDLHQIIYDNALLREGARVHLRMGYGSDPLSLAPMINGIITDITLGDQITMVITSDGIELTQAIVSNKNKDINNGFLGLFGIGATSESSNLIADIMCKRASILHYLCNSWFEQSAYGIEHYGLYFNMNYFLGKGITLDALTNEQCEQYDICKNIYKGNYEAEHYIYKNTILTITSPFDGEENVVFNKANLTPWDVFQIATQNVPEYYMKVGKHQFDSRLYFGLPFFLEKYRYDYINGNIYEECKTASQVHLLDSMTNIIDDQCGVTSRYTNTNVKVMYIRGSSAVSTGIIHSDDTIYMSKQKTGIIDSPIVQDYLGPDAVYEVLYLKTGKNSARRMGISNLIYGWNMQYQNSILCMGLSGVNANDYILVNDQFRNLYGIALVREVVHQFGINTGFTTSITPGLIAFSNDQNSGMIQECQNYLTILNCFSSYIIKRRLLRDTYEANLGIYGDLASLNNQIKSYNRNGYNIGSGLISADGLLYTGKIGSEMLLGYRLFKYAKDIKTIVQDGTYLTNVINTFTTAKNLITTAHGLSGLGALLNGIKTTGTAVLAPTGFGPIIWLIALHVVDVFLQAVIEYLDNKNVICLLPLWWDGYPFVSGIQGGEHILLIKNNNTATEENIGGYSTPNKNNNYFSPTEDF